MTVAKLVDEQEAAAGRAAASVFVWMVRRMPPAVALLSLTPDEYAVRAPTIFPVAVPLRAVTAGLFVSDSASSCSYCPLARISY